MSLIREVGPDGAAHYRQDPPDPSKAVVFTGPIKGDVVLKDGTRYNVADDWIEVDAGHAEEVAHRISRRFVDEGHPGHSAESPFVYEPPAKYAKEK